MYWYRGFTLEDAFEKLRAVRPCNPRLQAIRQATCDLLFDEPLSDVTIAVGGFDPTTSVSVRHPCCSSQELFMRASSSPSCMSDVKGVFVLDMQCRCKYRKAGDRYRHLILARCNKEEHPTC